MAIKNLLIKLGVIGGKKAGNELKSLAKSALKAGAAFFAAKGIVAGMSTSVKLAAQFEGVERGFRNLAKSTGFSEQAFRKFKSATDGTINSIDLMTQANNAMLLGIMDSEDQMAEMFDIAQRLAQSLGKDTTFGIESLVTGLGRQSKLMLDNLGIMIDVEKANEDYAESLNKSASSLTDQERKQAFVNATMSSARDLVGQLGEEQLTAKDKFDKLSASVDDLKIVLGDVMLTAIEPFVDDLNEKMEELGDIGWGNVGLALKENIGTVLAFAGKSAAISAQIAGINIMSGLDEGIKSAFPKISSTLDVLTRAFSSLFQATGRGVPIIGKSLKQSFDDAELDENAKKILELQAQLTALGAEGFEFVTAKALEFKEANDKSKESIDNTNDSLENTGPALSAAALKWAKLKDGAESSLKGLAMSQNLGEASRALANQYIVEGVFAAAKSALVKVPFPLNLVAATVAAAGANALFNELMPVKKAATGFDGVVNKPTMFLTGEAGPESVQVMPLTPGMNQNGPQQGITVNKSGGVVQDDYVRNELIPALNKATGTGARLNA